MYIRKISYIFVFIKKELKIMSRINELGEMYYFANRGLDRNKSPLPNKRYRVIIVPLERIEGEKIEEYAPYKFKDLGYLMLEWCNSYQNKDGTFNWNFHGFISVKQLKNLIGEKQYSKFCQGKREFIIQRRVDGKNVKRNKPKD